MGGFQSAGEATAEAAVEIWADPGELPEPVEDADVLEDPGPPGPAGTLVLPGDAERVGRYVTAAHAGATHRAYAIDADAFAIWCAHRGAVALPAPPETVAAYLTDLADAGAKPASITRRASGIGWAHAQAGHPRPTEHPGVRAVLRGIRRDAAARGVRTAKARALTPAQLRALVEDLPDTLAGARDRVVILLGYALGLRASDLVSLRVQDLTAAGEGLDVYVARSKTDQDGVGETLALAPGSER
jgi:site-specific recombinase XerD